ncbi:MAG TPA: gluconokinase [Burkholderiales bacterium]|nr:gluconokinase [Burkholderiales bacterium]
MIIILMGVSGCGKTTVGHLLAQRLHWPYLEADDFHPAANVEKMRAGAPLQDEDRWPWLDRLNATLRTHQARGENVILGCSALKEAYRDRLAAGCTDVRWVHLKGSFELIEARLRARKGHYMPVTLLRSQFATLEEPTYALVVSIEREPEAIAREILDRFALS